MCQAYFPLCQRMSAQSAYPFLTFHPALHQTLPCKSRRLAAKSLCHMSTRPRDRMFYCTVLLCKLLSHVHSLPNYLLSQYQDRYSLPLKPLSQYSKPECYQGHRAHCPREAVEVQTMLTRFPLELQNLGDCLRLSQWQIRGLTAHNYHLWQRVRCTLIFFVQETRCQQALLSARTDPSWEDRTRFYGEFPPSELH